VHLATLPVIAFVFVVFLFYCTDNYRFYTIATAIAPISGRI